MVASQELLDRNEDLLFCFYFKRTFQSRYYSLGHSFPHLCLSSGGFHMHFITWPCCLYFFPSLTSSTEFSSQLSVLLSNWEPGKSPGLLSPSVLCEWAGWLQHLYISFSNTTTCFNAGKSSEMIPSGQCSCWRHNKAKGCWRNASPTEEKTLHVLLSKMVWNRLCIRFHSLLRPS